MASLPPLPFTLLNQTIPLCVPITTTACTAGTKRSFEQSKYRYEGLSSATEAISQQEVNNKVFLCVPDFEENVGNEEQNSIQSNKTNVECTETNVWTNNIYFDNTYIEEEENSKNVIYNDSELKNDDGSVSLRCLNS